MAPPRCWRRPAPRHRIAASRRPTSRPGNHTGARPDLLERRAALDRRTCDAVPAPVGVAGAGRGAGGADAGDARRTVPSAAGGSGGIRALGGRAADLASVARPIGTPDFYWDLLRPISAALDIWETTYLHVLTGEDAVTQWASGSSLRPFLDRLPEEQREPFRRAYSDALRPHYPRRPDGTTLLPFRRLFVVARTE